jgi:Fic family protein
MNPDWCGILERQAKLEEAVSSIGVEGTVVSFEQAKAITTGARDVKIGEKERREFESYYRTLEFIKEYVDSSLSIGFLLKIHEHITTGDSKALPGKIRVEQNAVKRGGKIIYIPPPTSQVGFLLDEFIKWFNRVAEDKKFSPIIAGAICHFWFVWIHPFADGNGRVARILTTLLLFKKRSEGIKYFALSDYYNKNQEQYYEALKTTNKCDSSKPSMNFSADISPWLTFFVESFLKQVEKIEIVTNRILQLNIRVDHLRRDGLITEPQDKVLSFLYSREKPSYQELAAHLGGVTPGRVNQIMKPLREAKILIEEKIGKQLWFKLGSPETDTNEKVLIERKLKQKTVDKKRKRSEKPAKQAPLPIFDF